MASGGRAAWTEYTWGMGKPREGTRPKGIVERVGEGGGENVLDIR